DSGSARYERRLCGVTSGLGGRDFGSGGEIGLDGIIQFLLGDGIFLCQRGVAIHVELGLALIRVGPQDLRVSLRKLTISLSKLTFSFSQSRSGLIECRLERTRINLKQQLPFSDERAFRVMLL